MNWWTPNRYGHGKIIRNWRWWLKSMQYLLVWHTIPKRCLKREARVVKIFCRKHDGNSKTYLLYVLPICQNFQLKQKNLELSTSVFRLSGNAFSNSNYNDRIYQQHDSSETPKSPVENRMQIAKLIFSMSY